MSDEQKLEPLWSDEEIMAHARRAVLASDNIYVAMRTSMQMVRNDYETVRRHNEERRQQSAERIAQLEAENALLKAQLAESWRPVEDGFSIECDGQSGWRLYASEGDIGVVNWSNREEEYYVYAEPHKLCLCQRTTTPTGGDDDY